MAIKTIGIERNIDDAIEHCEEVASQHCGDKCGDEHKQLAAWLRELKSLRKERHLGMVVQVSDAPYLEDIAASLNEIVKILRPLDDIQYENLSNKVYGLEQVVDAHERFIDGMRYTE